MLRQVRSKAIYGLVAGVLFSSIAVSSAQAAKVTVAGAPTFVMIKSKQLKVKSQQVTVTLEKPANNGGSPVTSMIVEVQGKSCTIRGKANSCTIKGVPLKASAVAGIFATAINKKGKSKRARLFYSFASTTWLAVGFTREGKRFPTAVSKLQNSRILVSNSSKWKKFQAISRSSVSSASASKQAVPRVGNPSVIFNITGSLESRCQKAPILQLRAECLP